MSGVAETGDLFGDRLAFGLLGRPESSIRLAVSAPNEDGAAANTGLVQVFPVTNLDAEVSYAQNSPGIPGAAKAGDRFGASLAVVVGAPERAVIVGVPDDADNSQRHGQRHPLRRRHAAILGAGGQRGSRTGIQPLRGRAGQRARFDVGRHGSRPHR